MQIQTSTTIGKTQSETSFLLQNTGVFARFYQKYIYNGYSPLPIYRNSKVPIPLGWSDYCKTVIEHDLIDLTLINHPNAGLGLCNAFNDLLQLDVDVLDSDIQSKIMSLNSFKNAIRRIGNPHKLGVFYFRWIGKDLFTFRKWLGPDGRHPLVEVPCQCLAAPSQWIGIKGLNGAAYEIAPRPYVLVDASGFPLEALPHISELTPFGDADLEAVDAVLKEYLYIPKLKHEHYNNLNRDITPCEVGRYEQYAKKALISQTNELATASKGTRNHSIYLSALKLGKFLGGCLLSKADIEEAFEFACNTNGFIAEHGKRATWIQVANGLRDGKDAPLPDLGKNNQIIESNQKVRKSN